MKHPFYISLLLSCLLGWVACTGPVIIEEGEGDDDINVNDDNNGGESEPPIVWEPVPIVHEGTYASPYTIAEAQTLGRGKSVWIEGYIVGSVSGSMKSGCVYTLPTVSASNILLADTFPTGSANDHLYCMPIELPNGSIERDELNLYDNLDNYHCKLRIEGDITLYYKVAGIKNIMDYTFGWENENKDENEDGNEDENENENEDEDENEGGNKPEKPYDPDATRKDTLSIAEGIKAKGEQVYIRGYIVGYYNNSYIRFNPNPEEINTLARNNIVLADDINERDENYVIIVELPTKTALREQVNLKDNPQNLNRALTVKGTMEDFKDTDYHGCMNTLSGLRDDEDYYFSIE